MLHMQTLNTVLPTPFGEIGRRQRVVRSVRRTYAGWRSRFPRWANSGFDEYFLLNDALPLLSDVLAGERYPDPAQLARQWVASYRLTGERAQRALAEVTPVAADFLARLQIDYCGEPV